ncbi:unnamed protein product [Effrenium voratum]|nr:unnamed protein product [Effrenium voratum]
MASSWLSKAASMAQAAQERAKEAAEKAAKEAAKFRDEAQAAASGLAQGAERFLLPEAKANHRELVFEEGPLGFEIEGARVIAVDDEGQAARLGLRTGDELLAVDGDVIPSPPAEDTPEEGDARVKRLIRKWIKNKPRPVSLRFTLPVQSNDEPGGSERPAVEDTGVKAPEPDAGEAQDLDELAAGEPADPVQGVAWPDAAELDEGSGDGDGWDLDLAPLDIESDKEAPVTANGNEPSGEQEAVEAATALVEELPDMSTEELQVPDAQEEAVEEPAEPAVLEPEAAEAPAVMEELADTAEETLQATENATDGWDDLLGVDEQVPNAQEEAVEEPAEPAVLEPEAAEAPAVMEEPADTAEETLQVPNAQEEAVEEPAEPAVLEPEAAEAPAVMEEPADTAEETLQATENATDGWDDLLGVDEQVPNAQEEAVEEPAEPAVLEPEAAEAPAVMEEPADTAEETLQATDNAEDGLDDLLGVEQQVPNAQEEAVEEPAEPAVLEPEAAEAPAVMEEPADTAEETLQAGACAEFANAGAFWRIVGHVCWL